MENGGTSCRWLSHLEIQGKMANVGEGAARQGPIENRRGQEEPGISWDPPNTFLSEDHRHQVLAKPQLQESGSGLQR